MHNRLKDVTGKRFGKLLAVKLPAEQPPLAGIGYVNVIAALRRR